MKIYFKPKIKTMKGDKTDNDCNNDILNIVVRWVYILYIVEGYKSNLLLSLRIAKEMC